MKIDGKEIAADILKDLKSRVEKLKEKGITPHLYIILLSDDPSSASYVKQKLLRGEEIGVKITVDKENPQITTGSLIGKIVKLNTDSSVHGVIVQRPMPEHLDEKKIEEAIVSEKDVDGFNPDSKFGVPVALAVLEILKRISNQKLEEWLKSKNITVVGRGLTAGRPIINTLEKMGIKPQVISSGTTNREKILRNSDIIISAVGKPEIISDKDLKKGVILIGVGLHLEKDNKFHGDYDEEEIKDIASFYTPTPGGVGPVNVAMLMKNLVEAAENLKK